LARCKVSVVNVLRFISRLHAFPFIRHARKSSSDSSSGGEASPRSSLSIGTDPSSRDDDFGKHSSATKDRKTKMPFRERMARRFGDTVCPVFRPLTFKEDQGH
jgi:predicted oxidoreductase